MTLRGMRGGSPLTTIPRDSRTGCTAGCMTAAAAATRSQILRSARELFIARGYAATTMAAIADHAGVSPDTLYAVIGTKPVLFRELVETALSGTDDVVPGEQRDYVQQMRASA